jgi:hypothetical protein
VIITEEKKITDLVSHLVMRVEEVYAYDANIENYKKILQDLPSEYPAHLEGLRGMDPNSALQTCPIEDIETLSKIHQYERINFIIRTEIAERTKSESVRAAIEAQLDEILDEEQKSALIQQVLDARSSATA